MHNKQYNESNTTNLKIILIIIAILFLSGCLDIIEDTERQVSREVFDETPTQSPEIKYVTPSPISTPFPVTTATPIPTSTSQVLNLNGIIQRKHTWNYGGYEWYLSMNFDEQSYNTYKSRSHSRDYDLFASDPYDDEVIKNIANSLNKAGRENGLNALEIPYFAISFVQSLPYTSDKVTTGFDEYPRFPYETLYDGGGDCEDTSILASAILQEMGYGVVLIELPNHMAVGVKCNSDVYGSSINFNDQIYCYLGTTGEGWPVGKLPDEYKNSRVKIIPVYARPVLKIQYTYEYTYSLKDVYVDVDVNIINMGSENANNVKIYVALQTSDTSRIWDDIESSYLLIPPESSYTYNVKNLHAPTGRNFRVYVRAYGNNVISDEVVGDWITWTTN